MKQVLHLTDSLDLAGTENCIMNWYRNIDKTKIQFDFICLTDKNSYFKEEIEKLGGKIFIIKKENGLAGKIKFYFNLFKFLKKNKFYIFHTHFHYSSGFDCMIAFLAGIKERITISHFNEGYRNTPFYKKLFSKLLIKLFATKRIAASMEAGKTLYGNMSYTVIYNGIDFKKFTYNEIIRTEIRRKFNIEENFIVGHIGRFESQKNHNFLIDIFNEILKHKENAILLSIGEGPLEKEIKEKVKNLNIETKVKFLGIREDVNKLYQAMDCFILPSFFEGLGIVNIEAQCSGLPVFISDGVPDEAMICNTKEISLTKTAKQWADIILEKVKNIERKDCSLILKQAGFDIKDTVKQIEKVYLGK